MKSLFRIVFFCTAILMVSACGKDESAKRAESQDLGRPRLLDLDGQG